ncbi:FAD-binding oxidoreductase [Burkholderiaceae bacterium DAT-1]|nr:FAD-binding oxidoreductase [Burkholderiaceae bacterium DAT-1]
MRRWNGWGDDQVELALPESALGFLRERVPGARRPDDATLEAVLSRLPDSRLPEHPLLDRSPKTRLLHSRGQSLPDWLALRHGELDPVHDAVAFPESNEDVAELLRLARVCGAEVIPYGGGTSVVGHLTPSGHRPSLCVSMARLRRLLSIDKQSMLATFQAGVTGPDLEAQLRAQGYTLGHFPQSFEYSTLGGWVVTRSSGQQSRMYGRIEQMFAGGRLETPTGTLELPTFPASAAGPDLREWVLGSEGRMGILTEVTVRIHAISQAETFRGWFFPDWHAAEQAARALVQARVPVSMLRVSNTPETFTTLKLAGDHASIRLLERYLALRGCGDRKCMLLAGFTGTPGECKQTFARAKRIFRSFGGVYAGAKLGEKWKAGRYRNVYLRNALWAEGYAVDTFETALDWPRITPYIQAVEQAVRDALGGEPVHVYTHLSHVYAQGSSAYTTYVFRLTGDYQQDLQRWQTIKRAACDAIVAYGGTISHQHGVGLDHAPYLKAEKGERGMAALRDMLNHFDPDGIMNPGKLCD